MIYLVILPKEVFGEMTVYGVDEEIEKISEIKTSAQF